MVVLVVSSKRVSSSLGDEYSSDGSSSLRDRYSSDCSSARRDEHSSDCSPSLSRGDKPRDDVFLDESLMLRCEPARCSDRKPRRKRDLCQAQRDPGALQSMLNKLAWNKYVSKKEAVGKVSLRLVSRSCPQPLCAVLLVSQGFRTSGLGLSRDADKGISWTY